MGESDVALNLVGSLWRWFRPDAIAEGRRWIQQALALPGAPASARAKALYALGVVAMQQGEYRVAAHAWKESISIWRAVGDLPRLVDPLTYLGSIYRLGTSSSEHARLLGAAETAYPLVDVPGLVPYRSLLDQAVTALRESLG